MNDIIRTQNLCKHYKETIALDNVPFIFLEVLSMD